LLVSVMLLVVNLAVRCSVAVAGVALALPATVTIVVDVALLATRTTLLSASNLAFDCRNLVRVVTQ